MFFVVCFKCCSPNELNCIVRQTHGSKKWMNGRFIFFLIFMGRMKRLNVSQRCDSHTFAGIFSSGFCTYACCFRMAITRNFFISFLISSIGIGVCYVSWRTFHHIHFARISRLILFILCLSFFTFSLLHSHSLPFNSGDAARLANKWYAKRFQRFSVWLRCKEINYIKTCLV